MHPNSQQLAAYLDAALDETRRADLRAHLLTCPRCNARLERLRADANRIAALSSAPAPDMRAAVRARLGRPAPASWLGHAVVLSGALVTLLLLVVLVAARGGATLGYAPERLFVIDNMAEQLLEIDAETGMRRAAMAIGEQPIDLGYDETADWLYVLHRQGVAAIQPQPLEITRHWDAPQPLDSGAVMALDQNHGRLYIASPGQRAIFVLDATTLSETGRIATEFAPIRIALAPDGRTLYSLALNDSSIWSIDLKTSVATAHPVEQGDNLSRGWMVISGDGARLFVLRWGQQMTLSRIDTRSWVVERRAALAAGKSPWDLTLLPDGQLAIPRGDGQTGGVEIFAADTLTASVRIDPQSDQHHTVAGPAGTVFALTLGGDITRYSSTTGETIWQVKLPAQRIVSGIFVPGGWRWPF